MVKVELLPSGKKQDQSVSITDSEFLVIAVIYSITCPTETENRGGVLGAQSSAYCDLN